MNKNLLALLGIAPVLSPLHTLANDRPDPRPNIIFFLVDDMMAGHFTAFLDRENHVQRTLRNP